MKIIKIFGVVLAILLIAGNMVLPWIPVVLVLVAVDRTCGQATDVMGSAHVISASLRSALPPGG